MNNQIFFQLYKLATLFNTEYSDPYVKAIGGQN